MIIISNPTAIENEIETIHSLFEEGLQLFHIRKPQYGVSEMKQFISKINHTYKKQLVLHSHHDLAAEFGINRVHFNESKRKVTAILPISLPFNNYKTKGFHLSTSVHSIEDFNTLDNSFEYAFLGPVFPCISKENYLPDYDFSIEIKKRTNFTTRLVALGGISSKNIEQALSFGFDDVALLGTIWNSNNPIEKFKLCQQIDLLY